MKDGERQLREALRLLLNEKLSAAEEQSLKDEGFELKKPTRKAAVMIALYKKAVSGDLSAIKELCSLIRDQKTEVSTARTVMFVDDL